MIEVIIQLTSAVTGKKSIIGYARIANTGGGTKARGLYEGWFWRKRRDPAKPWRVTCLAGFPRKSYSPWELLKRLLNEIEAK